ncbi:MAG: YggT family protein [Candidatus Rhabdochlamydia sp.]
MSILLANIIHWIFFIYTIMLTLRILGSWFPSFSYTKFMHFLRFYTDPYLNVFRNLIPPIGGRLDLSPIIAFFVLQLLENFFLRLFI